MARKCQISGKRTAAGNSISHSHIKTKRKFKVNLVSKQIFIAHENRWVRLRLSTRMLRTLNKRGVTSLIKQYGQDLSVLKPKDSKNTANTVASKKSNDPSTKQDKKTA